MPDPPPKPIAYVSDERYVALPDVVLEFEGDAGSFEARSRATGAVYAELPPGTPSSLPIARLITSVSCLTACSAMPGPSG